MRRLFVLILIFSLLPVSIFSQSDAVYVYRNDGDFNAFLLSDIEQMTQSKEDTLGVLHEDYCVQEILTSDSLYRIPLSAIDSIGFHPLPIEYQPDVVLIDTMEGFEEWIIEASDSTILISNSIPTPLIPQVGKILFESSENQRFPEGFAGRLVNVTNESNGILLEFESPQLSEIFKTLQFVAHGITNNGNIKNVRRNANGDASYNSVEIINLPDNLTMSLGPLSLNVHPNMELYSYVLIREGEVSIKNRVKAHLDCEASLSISGSDDSPFKYEPEPLWFPAIKVPLGATGLFFRTALGLFLQAEITGQISSGLPFTVDGDITMSRINNNPPQFDRHLNVNSDFNYNLSINASGSVADGVAVQAGLQWGGNYAVVVLEGGLKLKADLNIHSDGMIDNKLYSAIKDTKVEGSAMSDVYFSLHKAYYKDNVNINSPHLKFESEIASIYILPEFGNLTWEESETSGSGHVNGSIYRETPLGAKIGWALYNEKDELCNSDMFSETYRFPTSWRNDGMYKAYFGLTTGAKYKAYPVVSFAGVKMRVNKSVDVITTPTVKTHGYENNGPQLTTIYGFCYYDAGSYPSDPKVGFAYSKDGLNWTHVLSTNLSVDGSFSAQLDEIDCITNYRYKAYVERNGIKHYGDEKNFTSAPPFVDGTWQVEQGDGDSYTVTFLEGKCSWSKPMDMPGSYGFGLSGNTFNFSVWKVRDPHNWGSYDIVHFSGVVDDINNPSVITGENYEIIGNDFHSNEREGFTFTATKQ